MSSMTGVAGLHASSELQERRKATDLLDDLLETV
jgi:hypothetical protein